MKRGSLVSSSPFSGASKFPPTFSSSRTGLGADGIKSAQSQALQQRRRSSLLHSNAKSLDDLAKAIEDVPELGRRKVTEEDLKQQARLLTPVGYSVHSRSCVALPTCPPSAQGGLRQSRGPLRPQSFRTDVVSSSQGRAGGQSAEAETETVGVSMLMRGASRERGGTGPTSTPFRDLSTRGDPSSRLGTAVSMTRPGLPSQGSSRPRTRFVLPSLDPHPWGGPSAFSRSSTQQGGAGRRGVHRREGLFESPSGGESRERVALPSPGGRQSGRRRTWELQDASRRAKEISGLEAVDGLAARRAQEKELSNEYQFLKRQPTSTLHSLLLSSEEKEKETLTGSSETASSSSAHGGGIEGVGNSSLRRHGKESPSQSPASRQKEREADRWLELVRNLRAKNEKQKRNAEKRRKKQQKSLYKSLPKPSEVGFDLTLAARFENSRIAALDDQVGTEIQRKSRIDRVRAGGAADESLEFRETQSAVVTSLERAEKAVESMDEAFRYPEISWGFEDLLEGIPTRRGSQLDVEDSGQSGGAGEGSPFGSKRRGSEQTVLDAASRVALKIKNFREQAELDPHMDPEAWNKSIDSILPRDRPVPTHQLEGSKDLDLILAARSPSLLMYCAGLGATNLDLLLKQWSLLPVSQRTAFSMGGQMLDFMQTQAGGTRSNALAAAFRTVKGTGVNFLKRNRSAPVLRSFCPEEQRERLFRSASIRQLKQNEAYLARMYKKLVRRACVRKAIGLLELHRHTQCLRRMEQYYLSHRGRGGASSFFSSSAPNSQNDFLQNSPSSALNNEGAVTADGSPRREAVKMRRIKEQHKLIEATSPQASKERDAEKDKSKLALVANNQQKPIRKAEQVNMPREASTRGDWDFEPRNWRAARALHLTIPQVYWSNRIPESLLVSTDWVGAEDFDSDLYSDVYSDEEEEEDEGELEAPGQRSRSRALRGKGSRQSVWDRIVKNKKSNYCFACEATNPVDVLVLSRGFDSVFFNPLAWLKTLMMASFLSKLSKVWEEECRRRDLVRFFQLQDQRLRTTMDPRLRFLANMRKYLLLVATRFLSRLSRIRRRGQAAELLLRFLRNATLDDAMQKRVRKLIEKGNVIKRALWTWVQRKKTILDYASQCWHAVELHLFRSDMAEKLNAALNKKRQEERDRKAAARRAAKHAAALDDQKKKEKEAATMKRTPKLLLSRAIGTIQERKVALPEGCSPLVGAANALLMKVKKGSTPSSASHHPNTNAGTGATTRGSQVGHQRPSFSLISKRRGDRGALSPTASPPISGDFGGPTYSAHGDPLSPSHHNAPPPPPPPHQGGFITCPN
uniref:Uncharacterized protein n=1 Tax=Chromera velia CCMP2878 TaxID=1169474 RepID=A0A0G4G619_9ALVE